MKIVITGPKCSGKSEIGVLLSRSVSIPFFDTDEIIEKSFFDVKGKALSCSTICSEYGEDFFRSYEKRAIRQVAKCDSCIVSTGGSALLNKTSRELLREDSVLVLLYASTNVLFKRLSEKSIPRFLNNQNSRDLFASRASLVIETLKPFADIIINSSEMDINKTLTILTDKFRKIRQLSFAKYTNKKSKSKSLLFLGKIDTSKFLFSIDESLIKKQIKFNCPEIDGIVLKQERLTGINKSLVGLFSIEADKNLLESIVNINKKFFSGTTRSKIDSISQILMGILARNILEDNGIRINLFFVVDTNIQYEYIQKISVTIESAKKYKHKIQDFLSAISMFFLANLDLKFTLDQTEKAVPFYKNTIYFYLAYSKIDQEVLLEIINLYCALVVFNAL